MINFSNITKQYGNRILYRQASFQINPGEKIGLVGPNGGGKTTVFRLIVGEESADIGQVTKPDKCVIGYFSQNIEEMSGRTALEEVLAASPFLENTKKRLAELEAQFSQDLPEELMTKALVEYGDLQAEFEHRGGYNMESRASEILGGLGFSIEDQRRPVESFSGGWKMRIALAKILALQPDVLLMDEPTNHLDLESIVWLESWIAQFQGAVLMTSHDRDFMNRLVSKIVEVAHQSMNVYSGNYDFYERERNLRLEQLLAAARRQEEMLAKEEEFIARFAARASHAAQVQSRVKKIEKIERIEIPAEEKTIVFQWPESPRGGDDVLRIEKLSKVWELENGKRKLVFENADAIVKRRDRVAVVGVNGAGKSTLLKVITQQTEASSGRASLGASTLVGYFSQNSLDVLNPRWTILEEVQSRIPQANLGTIRNLLGALKFSGEEVEKKISILSGGEKSRVVLATLLAKPLNFLVLDEPTNHLDIASREVLLEALKTFPGTLMIVSHDRHFLREITNRVFELHHHQMRVFDGTWDEYQDKKRRELQSNSLS